MTAPEKFDPAEYRALIGQALADIAHRLPVLDHDLVDTRQRGLGFLTPNARAAQNQQIRRERAARYPNTTAAGAPIPIGLRGVVRSTEVAAMPGERPVPVNLSSVSLAAEVPMVLLDVNRMIRRHLASVGVCHVQRPVDHPTITDLIEETRALVAVVAGRRLLLDVHRTIETLAQRVKDHVDGNDRAPHPRPCPHCDLRTLVVYLDAGVIRCERDPHTGRYEPCVCTDSYCGCKVRHHRHEWHRNHNASKSSSWQGLNRAQDLAERDTTTEGAPMPTAQHLHFIEVDDSTDSTRTVRFVCKGDKTSPCHQFPACECETNNPAHQANADGTHGPVPQDHCWQQLWLDHILDEGEAVEAYADEAWESFRLVSGPVEFTWEGDFMTWEYATHVMATAEHHPGCNDGCEGDVHQLLGGEA